MESKSMKRNAKIFFTAIIICALLFPAMLTAGADEIKVYTALGDSIAAGYALPAYTADGNTVAGGYVSRVGQYVGAEKIYDKAISGLDTNGLLHLIANDPSYKQAIAEAELITVSIGSNDILLPAIGMIEDFVLGESGSDLLSHFENMTLSELKDLLKRLGAYLNAPEQKEIAARGIETFKTNWTKVIDSIVSINPTAKIIVTNYYNPMYSLEKLLDEPLAQPYLDIMNEHVESHEYNEQYYTIVDVTEVGREKNYVNLDVESQNMDVHPSFLGHLYIFKQIKPLLGYEEETLPPDTEPEPEPPAILTETATQTAPKSEQKQSSCGGFHLSVTAIFLALTAITFVSLKRKN